MPEMMVQLPSLNEDQRGPGSQAQSHGAGVIVLALEWVAVVDLECSLLCIHVNNDAFL